MIKGMRKVGVAKEPKIENISMMNKYAYKREQFKKMIEEEKVNVNASNLVGSGLTPSNIFAKLVEMKDNIFHESVSLSERVKQEFVNNPRTKINGKLLVKVSNRKQEKTQDLGLSY